ncbi:L,D-transpeptidase family protein [Sphingomonas donggukensis]|uniref:L,D-transpeptidase family protein n=1 Tax=Sphingomonas donggukensis TaxID=2949093 RepID=A0ABY4U361_9SPHN|nr:L,D-transpeptidase family protein [Sphingomonas donggukensis]URW76993.1 L,D-transpeptidase family protein [Sphingomonas donggukensis]
MYRSAIFATATLMTVSTGVAQNAPQSILPPAAKPAPAPTPQVPVPQATPAAPQAQAAPVPVVAPSVPLPQLSPEQAKQITAMLAGGSFAQGLRHEASATPPPADNDGLVRAALDYARAVHAGRLATADFQEDWGLRPAAYDPLPDFAAAVQGNRLARWIAMLPPPYSGYDGLQKGLTAYRAIAARGGWKTLAAGSDLVPGAKGPRVRALRQRLAIEDKSVEPLGDVYDKELTAAVQRAQRRYGLNPTGSVATQTLAALNVSADNRVKQIMANMERWRWLPAELAKKRIQVNIAAAVLTVFDGDQPIMSMKGVTGRPGDETPMLQSSIHSVVLNPPWNVPSGIAERELWPKGAGYLKTNGFKVIGEGPNKRLQQQAGPLSALGRYKFDFDNPYAVYLHDTPAQAKFASFDRLASHGCVRLEKPADLARLLLQGSPDWTPEAIQATIAGGKTTRAKLPEAVTVYLLYWTAFASANGTMNFRADPYNWDGILADKIEKRSAIQAATIAR